MIAPQDVAVLERVESMVNSPILGSRNKHHVALVEEVHKEIKGEYEYSVRKSMSEWLLLFFRI